MSGIEGAQLCVCGCGQPATARSQYAGSGEREKAAHRQARFKQLTQRNQQQTLQAEKSKQALTDLGLTDTAPRALSELAVSLVGNLRTVVDALHTGVIQYQDVTPTVLVEEQRAATAEEIQALAARCAGLERRLADSSADAARATTAASEAESFAARVSDLLLTQDAGLAQLRSDLAGAMSDRDAATLSAASYRQESERLAEIVRLQGEALASRAIPAPEVDAGC